MVVDEFITKFRTAVLDVVAPPFWSGEEIVDFLNEAVQEACERAKLIEDRSTPAVCSVLLQPGIDTYVLHRSVLEIKRLACNGRLLCETSVEEQDLGGCHWEQHVGQPRSFIFEPANGARNPQVRLVPTPSSAGVAALTVYRSAIRPLLSGDCNTAPELPARYHSRLMHWMMYRGHLKQDADTFDVVKASEHLVLFEQAFGSRADANVQRKHRDDSPPLVHSSW